MTEEERLLRRLGNGDERALEQVIACYTPYVSAVLWQTAGQALTGEDREEIACDVFVGLWWNAGGLDPEKGTLRAYIGRAARNQALKRLRDCRETTPLEELTLPDDGEGPEDRVVSGRVWDAVAALGELDCELFIRYYKYGESLRRIAAATGLGLSAVKSRLSRGRKKLKTMLMDTEE